MTAPVMAAGTWANNAELIPPSVPAVEALEWAIDRATERVRLCERWLTPDWPHGNWRGGFTPEHLERAQAIHAALVARETLAAAVE